MNTITHKYLEWVSNAKLPPLTNAQHRFAEFLLSEEVAGEISKSGGLGAVFESVRAHLRSVNTISVKDSEAIVAMVANGRNNITVDEAVQAMRMYAIDVCIEKDNEINRLKKTITKLVAKTEIEFL